MNAATLADRWTVLRYSERTYQACTGAPIQAGATCDHCGRSIRYVVTMRHTAGQVINVGRDCAVTLEGGPELADIRRAEAAYQRECYLASPEYASRMAHEHDLATRRAMTARTAEIAHAMLLAGMRTIIAHPRTWEGDARWCETEQAAVLAGEGAPSDPRTLARLGRLYTRATMPRSTHLGNVGEKLTTRLLVDAIIPIDSMYGTVWLHKLYTASGQALAWKSTSGELTDTDVGKWVTVRFTVKSHGTYRDEDQTTILRVKRV